MKTLDMSQLSVSLRATANVKRSIESGKALSIPVYAAKAVFLLSLNKSGMAASSTMQQKAITAAIE